MASPTFGTRLRAWRLHHGISQMELSLRSEVSERHISFLETGRSRPSAGTIEKLAEALVVPLAERSLLHTSAGLPSPHREQPESARNIQPLRSAADKLLRCHEPYPALLFDRWWRVVDGNSAGRAIRPRHDGWPADIAEMALNPDCHARRLIENYSEFAWGIYRHMQADAFPLPHDRRLMALLSRAAKYLADVPRPRFDLDHHDFVLNPRLRVSDDLVIKMEVVIARFGPAHGAGADDLRVELVFPFDDAGDRYFRSLTPPPP